MSLQDPTKLNQVMHRLYFVSKAATLHCNDHKRHTEPHGTANTPTTLCLCLLTLKFSLRFCELPFGAQGPSPPVPGQQKAASSNGGFHHLPMASVSQDPSSVPTHRFIFPDQAASASKNPFQLSNPNLTTGLLCLGSSRKGYAVLI